MQGSGGHWEGRGLGLAGGQGLGVRSGPGRTPSPAPLSPQHCPSAPGQANGRRPLLAWLWRRGGSVRAGKGLPKKAQPVFRVAGGDVPAGTGRWRGASTAPPPQGRAVPSPVPWGWARHVQPHVRCFSLGWLLGGHGVGWGHGCGGGPGNMWVRRQRCEAQDSGIRQDLGGGSCSTGGHQELGRVPMRWWGSPCPTAGHRAPL